MKPLRFSATDLSLLHKQLEEWRQQQTGRGRLPPELWDAATRLGVTRGVSPVARLLRIDFYGLQRRVRALASSGPVIPAPNRFLELKVDPPPSVEPAAGWVELSEGPPRRMCLQTGHDPAAWVALAEAFWRTAP